MTSTRPVRAAIISGVSPPSVAASGSAPAASSAVTRLALPLVAASTSGVTPYRFAVWTLAPAVINVCAVS